MSKHDSLFKKAEVYERLALYGDRKSFLKALAQTASNPNAPTSYPGDVEDQQKRNDSQLTLALQQAQQLLEGAGQPNQATGTGALFPAKRDWAAIDREINRALMMGFGLGKDAQKAQLAQLQGQIRQLRPSAPAQPSDPGETITFPQPGQKMDQIKAYPPIDPKVQESVWNFAIRNGLIGPPNPISQIRDGQFGPGTKAAIKSIKDFMAQKENKPNATDAQAIARAQQPAPQNQPA